MYLAVVMLRAAPGGAGSFHGGTVPIWLIVVAVVVILVVGIGIIIRRRR
jgi:hypothetical protein